MINRTAQIQLAVATAGILGFGNSQKTSRPSQPPVSVMLNRFLNHLEEWIIAFLIGAATLLIFVSVMHRYSAGASIDLSKWFIAQGMPGAGATLKSVFNWLLAWDLSWAQELCIYMFVWMAKFGAAYGVRTGIHVGVDVLVNILSPGQRKGIVLFGLTCGALFTGVIAALGVDFVYHLYPTGQRSNDLEVPMWIVYLAIPLGSSLMSFRFLQVAWTFARTGELPVHDHGAVDGVDPVPAPHGAATAVGARS
jgi:C4-dicarboxylate transporter, DctM subunit